MKKKIVPFMIVIVMFLLAGCSQNKEVSVVKTYPITDSEMVQKCFNNNQFVTIEVQHSQANGHTF